MTDPALHHKITYIEFTTADIERTKRFYAAVFGWSFQDWGPDYISIENAGIDGGFRRANSEEIQTDSMGSTGPLIVLYSANLEATEAAILAAGGSITVPTFPFPGGRRFHFSDAIGNLLAVWSE